MTKLTDEEAEEIAQENYELDKLSQQGDIAKYLRSRSGKLYEVGRRQ